MDEIIKTENLDHSFGSQKVVNDLNLKVPKGSIYGFLGPNGAGKSTTIRLLLGLLPLRIGSIQIFNQNIKSKRQQILHRVGSMIEGPSYYDHLDAYQNLRIMAILKKVSKKRIEEVLNIVGLSQVRKKQVKKFSLGMKQRLGLATALLTDPDLLILDEPTNGLDPQGISEIRDLLKKLNKDQGKTIFLSSHLLAEVEQTASHIGIIQNGCMVFQGEVEELNKELKTNEINIRIPQDNHFTLIKESGLLKSHKRVEKSLYSIELGETSDIPDLIEFLKKSDIYFEEVYYANKSLEANFLSLTKSNII